MVQRVAVTYGLFVLLALASRETASADSTWMPRWLGGKSDSISDSPKLKKAVKSQPKSKSGGSNLFTNTKSLLSPKKKSKVISKWPPDRSNVSRKKEPEKKSWFGSMFGEEEKGPPRSVSEWMDLEQIKP